jgi:hypothetical protein
MSNLDVKYLHIHDWVSSGLSPAITNPPYDCYCTRGLCRGVFKASQVTVRLDINETIKQMKLRGEETNWLQSLEGIINASKQAT